VRVKLLRRSTAEEMAADLALALERVGQLERALARVDLVAVLSLRRRAEFAEDTILAIWSELQLGDRYASPEIYERVRAVAAEITSDRSTDSTG
jgi:hypothetical protein